MDSGKDEEEEVDPFDGMCCPHIRNVIWRLFEDPNSSKAARVLLVQKFCALLDLHENVLL